MELGDLPNLKPDSLEWELERARLIRESIDSASPELRPKLVALQYSLDVLRETMTPEQFMRYLFVEIQENLENMSDQLQCMVNTILEPGV